MQPSQSQKWLFPAESASGHLAETKEDREVLSKWGNDKLVEDHLRSQQQAISTVMFSALGDSLKEDKALINWLGPGTSRRAVTQVRLEPNTLDEKQERIRQAA